MQKLFFSSFFFWGEMNVKTERLFNFGLADLFFSSNFLLFLFFNTLSSSFVSQHRWNLVFRWSTSSFQYLKCGSKMFSFKLVVCHTVVFVPATYTNLRGKRWWGIYYAPTNPKVLGVSCSSILQLTWSNGYHLWQKCSPACALFNAFPAVHVLVISLVVDLGAETLKKYLLSWGRTGISATWKFLGMPWYYTPMLPWMKCWEHSGKKKAAASL